jgi:hypothetical protein
MTQLCNFEMNELFSCFVSDVERLIKIAGSVSRSGSVVTSSRGLLVDLVASGRESIGLNRGVLLIFVFGCRPQDDISVDI